MVLRLCCYSRFCVPRRLIIAAWYVRLLESAVLEFFVQQRVSPWPSHVSYSTQLHFLSSATFCNCIWIIEAFIGNTLQNIISTFVYWGRHFHETTKGYISYLHTIEKRMLKHRKNLSGVPHYCQVTMIVINRGSQLSEISAFSQELTSSYDAKNVKF